MHVVAGALGQLADLETVVEMASDGDEAPESPRRRRHRRVRVSRADGGLEVSERLRSDVRSAFGPVLMLTRHNDEVIRTKRFVVGCDDFMSKPFAGPAHAARVRRLLRRSYGF